MISADRFGFVCFGAFFDMPLESQNVLFVTPQEGTCCPLSYVSIVNSWRVFLTLSRRQACQSTKR